MESSAKHEPEHPSRLGRWMRRAVSYLRTLFKRHGYDVQNQLLQGVAYKLGSGAVTLLILWWETRR
ncbi:hypothetical protein [Streptomyces caniscabiei]|uniref:hypothetical protein n=1 Tax=Streptomyces caniscabiei TaxID=2746961 RepID=UPI000A37FA9D|nr:hypothetical protein [Streptomyces caniscabiei]